jgi:predicted alpha/beta superfamily hydrolase
MEWILDDIKPMIDEEYRTLPQREHTAIGGSSMGGLMALYAVTQYNAWFSGAACVSTAMGLCYRSVVDSLKNIMLQKGTKVYLSWGTQEAFLLLDKTKPDSSSITWRQNRMAAKLLKRNGADVKLVCQVGGRHCEADWEKQNKRFMDYLWK